MIAREMMSGPPVTVGPEDSIADVARKMLSSNVSCIPVVDPDSRVVGILTHTDFGLHPKFRPLAHNVYSLLGAATTPAHIAEVSKQVGRKKVRDVMHHLVTTVDVETSIERVVELMLNRGIHRVPVTEDGKLVGVITRHDFLKLIAAE